MCVLDRAVEKERKGGGGESGEAREAFKGGGGRRVYRSVLKAIAGQVKKNLSRPKNSMIKVVVEEMKVGCVLEKKPCG